MSLLRNATIYKALEDGEYVGTLASFKEVAKTDKMSEHVELNFELTELNNRPVTIYLFENNLGFTLQSLAQAVDFEGDAVELLKTAKGVPVQLVRKTKIVDDINNPGEEKKYYNWYINKLS